MPMNNEDFATLVAKRRADEDSLLTSKGEDYARIADGNRLRNFELVAMLLDGAPMDAITVCAVYWLKQVIALCTMVSTRKLESEPLGSRFTDVQNYGYLLESNFEAISRAFETLKADLLLGVVDAVGGKHGEAP